ncbi:MAG: hypothetical protein ACRDQZ_11495 [Mycobacteriales bacterium]
MSTTREIIDRLKALKSPRLTSDNQVAAVLGVTRQAVSRWQKGHDAMSLHVLQNARDLLKLSDAEYVELGLRLTADRNQRNHRDAEFWSQVVGVWKKTVRRSGVKLSSILLTALLGALLAAPGENRASSDLEGGAHSRSLYIMTNRRRRLGRWLKNKNPRPLLPGLWAWIRSWACVPRSSFGSPAYT